MSNRNPVHNARANAKKALGARRAQEEKRKRMTRAQKEAARIELTVAWIKKREASASAGDGFHDRRGVIRNHRICGTKL